METKQTKKRAPKKPSVQLFGMVTYPGGRVIELQSPHREWLDWAQKALYNAAANEPDVSDDPLMNVMKKADGVFTTIVQKV